MGGLSCLFSSPTVKHAGVEELGSMRHDRSEELSSSFCYLGSSMKRDRSESSPVSVFQGPVSCSSSVCGSSRSPPMGIGRERSGGDGAFRVGPGGLFNGFVRGALDSCIDYDSPTFEIDDGTLNAESSSVLADELTFNMEDNFRDDNSEPHVKDLLFDAQLRHKIFSDDFVIKAFYEAERAHRGQV